MQTQKGKPVFVTIHGKGCTGCEDTNTDVMISTGKGNGSKIRDVFMSNEEAIKLRDKLTTIIRQNR